MQGFEAYQVNDIETASGLKLVVMLYEGAIRFCHVAADAVDVKDYERANTHIIKAQNIVSELLVSLNYEAGELAQTLSGLYLYIHRRLVEANLQKDKTILLEVIELLENLKSGWAEILKKESPPSPDSSRLNISG